MTARWMTRWNPAVGFEFLALGGDHAGQFGIDIVGQAAAQHVEIDVAGLHHGGGILVVDEGQKQVFERRVFVAGVRWPGPRRGGGPFRGCGRMSAWAYSFSIVHCSGCWWLRAKSMTCVTLVSATSKVIYPADADALLVDVQHDAGGLLASLVEEPFKDVDDELHRRVVVVEKQHLVERRLLGLRFSPGDDTRLIVVLV